jgi:hypothetical protein
MQGMVGLCFVRRIHNRLIGFVKMVQAPSGITTALYEGVRKDQISAGPSAPLASGLALQCRLSDHKILLIRLDHAAIVHEYVE